MAKHKGEPVMMKQHPNIHFSSHDIKGKINGATVGDTVEVRGKGRLTSINEGDEDKKSLNYSMEMTDMKMDKGMPKGAMMFPEMKKMSMHTKDMDKMRNSMMGKEAKPKMNRKKKKSKKVSVDKKGMEM